MHTDERSRKPAHSFLLFCFICVYLCSSVAKNSLAGSITTLDGKRIEGTVSVDSKSSLLVSPKNGSSPTRVEMANVLQAQMAGVVKDFRARMVVDQT